MKMRVFILWTLMLSSVLNAREWKHFNEFKASTGQSQLSILDWLEKDRLHNTIVWQNANRYNLYHGNSHEYITLAQRKDFYNWFVSCIDQRGDEVQWPKMARYISSKLYLVNRFPYKLLTTKQVKKYVMEGSEVAFHSSFGYLSKLFFSDKVLVGKDSEDWDKRMLEKEQYQWVEEVYQTMDEKSLRQLEHIAKGKSLYGIIVPKKVRFEGDLREAEDRYNYAENILKPYCLNRS